ncbi:histone-lysine N-methyltransferase family member SUVH9-like, partial [Olea europaea subsp. europaea]
MVGRSSNGEPIATSIIVSEGYKDDEDAWDVIIYIGMAGRASMTGRPCIINWNLTIFGNGEEHALRHHNVEERVIRCFRYEGSASEKVYIYDGLYRITDTWFDVGKSGFGVYKFKLVRIRNQVKMGRVVMKFAKNLRFRPLEVRPK